MNAIQPIMVDVSTIVLMPQDITIVGVLLDMVCYIISATVQVVHCNTCMIIDFYKQLINAIMVQVVVSIFVNIFLVLISAHVRMDILLLLISTNV